MEQFIVGFVRGSHGLAGNFKVESASGEYEHFYSMKQVTLRNGKSGESAIYNVESVDGSSVALYMKLEGVDSAEEAKRFNGWEIVVERAYAKKLKKNEWYIEDLKQCVLYYFDEQNENAQNDNRRQCLTQSAESKKTVNVGTVTDVIEGGGGFLLEVALKKNPDLTFGNFKKAKKVYVPLSDFFVRDVDVKNKRIRLMNLWILE